MVNSNNITKLLQAIDDNHIYAWSLFSCMVLLLLSIIFYVSLIYKFAFRGKDVVCFIKSSAIVTATVSVISSCILCSTFFICVLRWCYDTLSETLWHLVLTSVLATRICLYVLFIGQLYYSFVGSIYSLSKQTLAFFAIVLSLDIIAIIILNIDSVEQSQTTQSIILSIHFLFDLTISASTMYQFTWKLYQLVLTTKSNSKLDIFIHSKTTTTHAGYNYNYTSLERTFSNESNVNDGITPQSENDDEDEDEGEDDDEYTDKFPTPKQKDTRHYHNNNKHKKSRFGKMSLAMANDMSQSKTKTNGSARVQSPQHENSSNMRYNTSFSHLLKTPFLSSAEHHAKEMIDQMGVQPGSLLNSHQKNLIQVITRATLLNIIAIISNIILGIFFLFRIVIGTQDLSQKKANFANINAVQQLLDSLIIIVCIYLNFKFSKKEYKRCCNCCHKRLYAICVGRTEVNLVQKVTSVENYRVVVGTPTEY